MRVNFRGTYFRKRIPSPTFRKALQEMPKRKREDGDFLSPAGGGVSVPGQPSKVLRKKAEEKIFHGRKLLQRALKVSKGFERQKLGRRQKQAAAGNSQADIARIEKEILVLKDLDLATCAEHHLNKTLLKIKAVATSPSLPSSVNLTPKGTQDDVSIANVTARLYNSNPVKEALKGVLKSVQVALEVEVPDSKKPEPRSRHPDRLEHGPSNVSASPEPPSLGSGRHRSEDRATSGVSEESESDDGTALDRRVVGSSEDESESEGEGVSALEARHRHNKELLLSPSTSASSSRSGSSEPISRAQQQARKAPSASNTSFLPSLTMGGYWSGSEGGSDVEQDVDVAPRKNRRGQRARQQIWEKKYGKGAKHLKNAKPDAKNGRDEGWDMKRGAQEEGAQARRGYKPHWQRSRAETATAGVDGGPVSGGNAVQLAPRRARQESKPERPMHPSWEAAKRAKEQSQTGAFAGKKMVFD